METYRQAGRQANMQTCKQADITWRLDHVQKPDRGKVFPHHSHYRIHAHLRLLFGLLVLKLRGGKEMIIKNKCLFRIELLRQTFITFLKSNSHIIVKKDFVVL